MMVNNHWLVVSNHEMDYFPFQKKGCHPKPIDELHHFSEGWLNHQPDYIGTIQ
jgi:hypothetical protein